MANYLINAYFIEKRILFLKKNPNDKKTIFHSF